MKSILKKMCFAFMFFISLTCISKVQAASANISASKISVTEGEAVSINVSINAASWSLKLSGSGVTDDIVGYDLDANNVTTNKSYSLNTNKAGTYTIYLKGDITDANEQNTDINKSVTITVKAPQTTPSDNNSNSNSGTTGTNTNTSSGSNSGSSGTNNNSSSSGSSSTSTSNSGSTSTTTTTTQTKSSNANLSNLITSPVDFTGFKANKTEGYSITVENNVTEVKVTAKVQDSKASYKVTGNTNLKAGQTNVVKVTVTAEDGTQKVYKINVIRKNSEENNVPNIIETPEEKEITKKVNLTLKSLEIKGLILNPEFSSNVYEYTADLTEGLTELEVLAIATQADDTIIEITGNKELKDGENIITIVVKSSDKKESKTYTVKVNKKVEEVIAEPVLSTQSNDNNQTGITIAKVDFSKYSKTQKIISLIMIACTICLVGIDIYILNEERKFSDRKQKYVGKRIKI